MQSNMQVFGRLREIPGVETIYRYVYCRDIQDQVRLHFDRRNSLIKLAKTYTQEDFHKVLRVR